MTGAIDRGCDLHTHSNSDRRHRYPECDGGGGCGGAGLHTWGLSDHVRADSDWVIDYVRLVRGLRMHEMQIRCGVEAKILDTSGRLDLPATLPRLDYVLVADHQFPSATGPLHPSQVARMIADRALSTGDVVDHLVQATCAAVHRSPARPIVVHPFSLLPKMGLSEDDVGDEHLRTLAAACRTACAAVEINEKWRCPSPSVFGRLQALGVELVAGSDAHQQDHVGAWSYLNELTDRAVRRANAASSDAPAAATAP